MANCNYRPNDCNRRTPYARPINPMPPHSNCDHDTISHMPLAMAYVPWQEWRNIYSAEKGLCIGTIFEDLNKPFSGTGGCCK